MMLGQLVPCGGGLPIPLRKPRLVIGRKPDCDVTLPCPSVSGRHCSLEFEDGAWWVRDLESRNGTSVNGRKGDRQRVAPRDVLGIGRQRLVVEYQLAPKPAATTKPTSRRSDEDLAFEFLNDPEMPSSAPQPQAVAATVESARVPVAPERLQPARPAAPQTPLLDLGRLVPCGGGAPIPLRGPELIVGRSSDCDIRLRFPSISSRHCKLNFSDGYWLVEDLNSTNGTWVDGDRCMFQCLMPDSVLTLHKYRYTIHYVPQGDNEPPVVKKLFSQSLLEKAGLAKDFSGDRLSGELLPDDNSDLPKRYNLLDSDDD